MRVRASADGTRSLQWDEHNLQENQDECDQADPRMKIDEPKTPFVPSAEEPLMEEEEGASEWLTRRL